MDQDNLDSLAYVDESSSERYNSKAVFSQLDIGVEVEDYESFRLYRWEERTDFDEVIEAIEPYFAFLKDPALEMLEEKQSLRFRSGKDYDTMRNDFLYDPVREWRGEERWSNYNLIQLNLPGAKVVWNNRKGERTIRVYEIDDNTDVFEKLFTSITEDDKREIIAEDVAELERNRT